MVCGGVDTRYFERDRPDDRCLEKRAHRLGDLQFGRPVLVTLRTWAVLVAACLASVAACAESTGNRDGGNTRASASSTTSFTEPTGQDAGVDPIVMQLLGEWRVEEAPDLTVTISAVADPIPADGNWIEPTMSFGVTGEGCTQTGWWARATSIRIQSLAPVQYSTAGSGASLGSGEGSGDDDTRCLDGTKAGQVLTCMDGSGCPFLIEGDRLHLLAGSAQEVGLARIN